MSDILFRIPRYPLPLKGNALPRIVRGVLPRGVRGVSDGKRQFITDITLA